MQVMSQQEGRSASAAHGSSASCWQRLLWHIPFSLVCIYMQSALSITECSRSKRDQEAPAHLQLSPAPCRRPPAAATAINHSRRCRHSSTSCPFSMQRRKSTPQATIYAFNYFTPQDAKSSSAGASTCSAACCSAACCSTAAAAAACCSTAPAAAASCCCCTRDCL